VDSLKDIKPIITCKMENVANYRRSNMDRLFIPSQVELVQRSGSDHG